VVSVRRSGAVKASPGRGLQLDVPLGEGGMCVVRLAFDRRAGREIAMKP
jgi:hypothetical protein